MILRPQGADGSGQPEDHPAAPSGTEPSTKATPTSTTATSSAATDSQAARTRCGVRRGTPGSSSATLP